MLNVFAGISSAGEARPRARAAHAKRCGVSMQTADRTALLAPVSLLTVLWSPHARSGLGPRTSGTCVSVVAPMHGPAVSSALPQLLREYRNWIGEQIKAADAAVVCVLYAGWVLRCSQEASFQLPSASPCTKA